MIEIRCGSTCRSLLMPSAKSGNGGASEAATRGAAMAAFAKSWQREVFGSDVRLCPKSGGKADRMIPLL